MLGNFRLRSIISKLSYVRWKNEELIWRLAKTVPSVDNALSWYKSCCVNKVVDLHFVHVIGEYCSRDQ